MALNDIMIVIDPTHEQQATFERGLESARLTGARLHLYLCLDPTSDTMSGAEGRALLEQLTIRAESEEVASTQELEFATDWQQQVIIAAARSSASMVFKDSRAHSDIERQLRNTSDWTLLRGSPCPVLMVKNFSDWHHRRVLAAVYSQSTDEAHIKLNYQITSFAREFADGYGSDAHFVNAYQDRNHVPLPSQLADRYGAPHEHIHIVEGVAAEAISATAETIGADLIIIGTVGRSGIKGRVIGNTAERLLDHTQADVMVVN